ncbi:TPA: YgiW/YdeI family stress tolerance OB fold protein [Mannheimia haemolytica]
MKKVLGLTLMAMALSACNSTASNGSSQANTGVAPANVISVKQALAAADDSYVTVEGTLLNKVGDETYLFKDATGQIRVEIDDEVWAGQHVSSEGNKVRLYGEIDKGFNKTELDVKTLTVIKS